ncbi:MAG TPA: ABC transporter ATP-binding protein [Terracidiphilus sp.]|nr:ABC transporter ATP-binding protein [Terracidiphilus sp.]
MLEVQNLFKNYRGIAAVEDVSFKVGPGEIVGLLGPNGAGKSTTIKIVTGLLRPNHGRVLYKGSDVSENMVAFRSRFGYVPEEAQLYTYMSGLEYLQLVGRLRGLDESLIERKGARLLKLLQLESWRHTAISAYSKGMRQRVLIAAALLHDPELLIFDEPLSGLDVVSSRLFKDLLELLAAQGKAVIYISHVLEVVEQICHRVVVISKGRIVADAPPAELTMLMQLSTLERVFAQLVEQQDTQATAHEIVEAMRYQHA